MSAVRVLVVDDSASMRQLITQILESDPRLEVVGFARNGAEAIERIKHSQPDVVTLDVNMPVMDGLSALRRIMIERPTPCVMISSFTQQDTDATIAALEFGAVDFVGKPSGTVSLDIDQQRAEIIAKVHSAGHANVRRPTAPLVRRRPAAPLMRSPLEARLKGLGQLVAVGVSTGGPQTLLQILPELPANLPAAVAIVQHMPPKFTTSLARSLDEACALTVREATHNEPLLPGTIYIAPGGQHLTVHQNKISAVPIAQLSSRPSGTQFCPSVGVLFDSVAQVFGRRAVGVLLTGMGDDGADGMVHIRRVGGITIAEAAESCVVFGMSREAIARGGAEIVSSSEKIADDIIRAVERIAR